MMAVFSFLLSYQSSGDSSVTPIHSLLHHLLFLTFHCNYFMQQVNLQKKG